jgi:NADH dehydrogenase
MDDEYPVVIVGAGFAGVEAAKKLGAHGVRTLLIDRHTYHQFQPLLYQVATAQLGVSEVARPIRSITHRHKSVTVLHADVTAIDAATRTVTTADGDRFTAEKLVIALGAEANFFDTPGAAEHTYPLYSVIDAIQLGARLVQQLEEASRTGDQDVHIVVVGGGPTGVETAGALAETVRWVVPEYYTPEFAARCTVHLVDLLPNLLNAFDEKNQRYAARRLERVGVELKFGSGVTEVTPDGVTTADGTYIPSRLVVWGGGLKAGDIVAGAGLTQGRGGRIDVNQDLTAPGVEGVYVIGDTANMTDARGDSLPQLGSVAKQAGAAAARNIRADLQGEGRLPFNYRDKGYMAMVGRGAAVAEIGRKRWRMQGFLAFMAWLAVHVALLSGFWQKVRAVLTWIQDYLSHDRSQVFLGTDLRDR